jgi:beta-lactam-binding protein with PASTA domain
MRILEKRPWPMPPADTEITEEIEEGPPPRPPRGGPPWDDLAPWLLLLLLVVAGGLAAAYFLTRDEGDNRPAARATTVTATAAASTAAARPAPAAGVIVPYLVGKPAAEAVERLSAGGLRPQVKSVFSTKRQGLVVSQRPSTGTRLAKGSLVTLNVSKGRALALVPDVVGQTGKQAVALLRAAGLGARVVEVPSSEPAETVVAQAPKASAKAPKSTVVRLNVATGAPVSTAGATTSATPPATTAPATTAAATTPIRVPDVVGQKLAQARASIRASGLVTEVRYVPSSQPEGTVVAQSPKPEASAKRRDHVLVNVSRGPTQTPQATVPDVVGSTEAAARTQLRSAGFTVSVQDAPAGDASQDGIVVDEQPAAGTTAPRGSEITVYVGRSTG